MLIILGRACYGGYDRGVIAEVLHLFGLVAVTALTFNFAGPVAAWSRALLPWQPDTLDAVLFWLFFLALLGVKQVLIRSLTSVVKADRLHWLIQGVGVILGAVRGLWWAGLLLLALVGSGFVYLQQSVEEQSVISARLLPVAREIMTTAADLFPGADQRGPLLIPALYHAPDPKTPRT